MELWLDRQVRGRNYSEISGVYLGKEPLSVYFHHILSKSKYPDLIFLGDNIILVTFDEHQEIENGKEFEEVKMREKILKNIYRL